MAAVDQAADLQKKLSLDSQSKTLEVSESDKKPSVDSGVNGNGQSQPLDRSLTPLIPDFMDPTVAYFPNGYTSPAYYFGGYDGATNDYSRYLNTDGIDVSHGLYGETGSLMYPGYGYAPYGPYSPAGSPVPTAGHNGQLYGTQHYQYSSPYFQSMTQTAVPPIGNQNPVFNSNGGRDAQNGFQDPRYGFGGVHSPSSWLDKTSYSNGQTRSTANPVFLSNANGFASKNQNIQPQSHLLSPRPMLAINAASGYMNSVYPNKLYGQYQGAYGSGFGFGSNSYGSQNRQGWLALDNKYKPRGRGNSIFGYNNENSDGLNELNRGPRTQITKNQKVATQVPVTIKGRNGNSPNTNCGEKDTCTAPNIAQYNQTEFPETYTDAKFFIIKSYSEDDVHKSVKYSVWSSTQNGNKKLDAAYQEAQQKPEKCPIFLLFSVNTSGQFVGVAEMVGPVDFNKNLEYWQQDKWVGYFPVKWHIIKDVPNSLLKHIILQYNENKPVTNSRDTQEVKLEQGLQMIKVFKDHSSKQCILDDFEFYEERQKRIQEKKAKNQFPKQPCEEKPISIENIDEVTSPDLVKEDVKLTENLSIDQAI